MPFVCSHSGCSIGCVYSTWRDGRRPLFHAAPALSCIHRRLRMQTRAHTHRHTHRHHRAHTSLANTKQRTHAAHAHTRTRITDTKTQAGRRTHTQHTCIHAHKQPNLAHLRNSLEGTITIALIVRTALDKESRRVRGVKPMFHFRQRRWDGVARFDCISLLVHLS